MLAVQMKVDKDCLSCLVKQEENKSHAGKNPLSLEALKAKHNELSMFLMWYGFGLRITVEFFHENFLRLYTKIVTPVKFKKSIH